ncbi:hypothetical protein GR184_11350 [Bacillus sp. BGMRC0062]|uniref:hypothetical protein n=1 Tax=Kocuria rhizophila TaxID=72000 RepID=UPI000ADE4171|nr:hypothetical protein [Kocuria rhizophila]MXN63177.1 hypothetical protein [Bacillus sp. BGMRC0062]
MTARKTPNPLKRPRAGASSQESSERKPPTFEATFDPAISGEAPAVKKKKYTILLTPEQRDKLRLYAAHRDIAMSEVIVKFIEDLDT